MNSPLKGSGHRSYGIGASTYKRIDYHDYQQYPGKSSAPKDHKMTASTPYPPSPTLLPRISREEKRSERTRLPPSRERRREEPIYSGYPESRRLAGGGQAVVRSQIRARQSDKYLGYLRDYPQEKESIIRQSRHDLEDLHKPKTVGLVGLNNIGNTCFMNSILQCMLNLPKFNDYFMNNQHLKEAHTNSRVAMAYGRLVQLMKTSTSRSETPSEIKGAVASRKNIFSGYGQQDAQEFLLALLEHLSQDLNRSKKPKYRELKADLSKQSLEQISEEWWRYNLQRENSIVCDYFTGQLLSKVICGQCGKESIAFDNTQDFCLNFSYGDGGDILKMIQNFLKEESLSHDYYCAKCKALRDCRRKFYLYRLPQILVLQIKRFSYGKYSKSKLNNRIKVPITLNLSSVVSSSSHHSVKSPLYDLVGVVNHSGEINYGHYTADCRNPINNKWYHFNDSSVSETRVGEVIDSSSPYLLFYCKKNITAHI